MDNKLLKLIEVLVVVVDGEVPLGNKDNNKLSIPAGDAGVVGVVGVVGVLGVLLFNKASKLFKSGVAGVVGVLGVVGVPLVGLEPLRRANKPLKSGVVGAGVVGVP
jgi:hypothetical protein